MKQRLLAILFSSTFFISGCNENKQIRPTLEDLSLVSSIGFDVADNQQLRMTLGIPEPPGDTSQLTRVYSTDTELIQEGLAKLSSESDKMLVLNQLRTLLFSEEFARTGKITEVVELLYRDSTLGNKVRLGIVEGQAEDVLRASYPENKHMDAYLNDLLQPKLHNSFGPFTSIHDYINTQTSPVYHTMIPLIEKKENSLEVTKVAVFDNKKMVDTITNEQSLLIQALSGMNKLSPLAITFKDNTIDHQAFLERIDNKVKIKTNKDTNNPRVDIELSIKAVLIEYKGTRELGEQGELKKFNQEISKYLRKEIEDTLEDLREMALDPAGITEKFRMHYKGNWTDELTKQVITSSEYNVKVDFSVKNAGTLK